MEQLKAMKETLMAVVQGQLGNLQNVDAKELGEVVDMIKDLAEASYYCSIEKAMEEEQENRKNNNTTYYYTEKIREPFYTDDPRRYDRMYNRMYYDGDGNSSGRNDTNGGTRNYGGGGNSSGSSSSGMSGGSRGYSERMMRDSREGRSPESRRMYMEGKQHDGDKLSSLRNLEQYMKELSGDITEMIQGSSLEEKQMLQKKLEVLAQKVME